jgi:hypothetical protein
VVVLLPKEQAGGIACDPGNRHQDLPAERLERGQEPRQHVQHAVLQEL